MAVELFIQRLYQNLSWHEIVVCGLVLFVTYLVYSFGMKPFLSPLRRIPGPPYNPLFGNVREAMVGQAMDSSVRWVKKYGGIVRFYHLLGRERLLVADPKSLKYVMVTNEDNYRRILGGSRLLGSGIFNTTGSVHKAQRRLLNPFFSQESIKGYLSVFQQNCEDLIEFWKVQCSKHEEDQITHVDIQDDLFRMTLDIIGQAVFGHDFNSLHNKASPTAAAIHKLTSRQSVRLIDLLPYSEYIPTKDNVEFDESLDIVNNLIYGIIEKKRALFETEEGKMTAMKDFLGKLMLARDEDGNNGFTDRELRDQVLSILIAGHETTAVTLSWLLLTLAQHPEQQELVREEIQSKGLEGQSVTWESLEDLKYLIAVIKEGQRLYPAAPSFTRRTKKDDNICGYFVPKDTTVIYHVGAMMRNPKLWQDPESFKPERFIDTNIDLYSYIPFATGPHLCLGHRFAKMEIRHVLVLLLQKFQFHVIPGMKFVRKLRTVLKSSPAIKLGITPLE